MKLWHLFFVFAFTAGVFAGGAKAGFVTGTDDEDNFYFPQIMAEWCELNFDANPDAAEIKNCFQKTSSDYHAPNATDAFKAKKRFKKMKMEALINAFKMAHEAKKMFANDKEEEVGEEINIKGEENDVRAQMAGNGELALKGWVMDAWILHLKIVLAEISNFDNIENNSEQFVIKEGQK